MDPEIKELKELVRQNAAVTKETNQMVRSLRNAARWARAFRLLWIALIIAVSFGAYVYLAPYIDQLLQLYGSLQGALDQAKEFGSQFSR